jgi:hypothetical protein
MTNTQSLCKIARSILQCLTLILVLFFPGITIASPNCTYAINGEAGSNLKAPTVSWTAFKTTAKSPVTGKFKLVEWQATKNSAKSLNQLLKNLEARVLFSDSSTDAPPRDQTLFQKFFLQISKNRFVKYGALAVVKKVHLDENTGVGTVTLDLTIGSMTKTIEAYASFKDQVLKLKWTIDLLQWGLKKAHASLHEACYDLHKGPDGVSKTWTEVEIVAEGGISRVCPSGTQKK